MYYDDEDNENNRNNRDNRNIYQYKSDLKKLFIMTLIMIYIIKTFNINFYKLYLSLCNFIKNSTF